MKKMLITMGDPAGIGPEVILKSLKAIEKGFENICIIGNREIFSLYEAQTLLSIPEDVCFINIPYDISNIEPGKESEKTGELSFLCIKKACEMAKKGLSNIIVTAPISKSAINKAGYKYSGHTEILQNHLGHTNKNRAEMLFTSYDFRVLILTRHVPVNKTSELLTIENIIQSIKTLNNSLKKDFHIKQPKMAICGFNPHAGEEGLLGKEEIENILPAIKIMQNQGIDIEGPFPADTLFMRASNSYLNNSKQPYDCYIACYHDQGLIPIKMIAMEKTVNITIGLPIIRTSPAHGTAFDIAGKNIADYHSMLESIKIVM